MILSKNPFFVAALAGALSAALLCGGLPVVHADSNDTSTAIVATSSALSLNTNAAAGASAATSTSAATSSEEVASADTCSITAADIARITAVENDPSFTPSEEVVQELAVRKQLISQTITCAQGEVQDLQAALAATPVDGNQAAKQIQSQLAGRLSDATNFYTLELGKLNGAGIAGTEAVAAETLAWREGAYASLAGQVGDFLLWAQNQNIFATAATRMTQTQQAVNFFEAASPNTDLQNDFNAAYASFQTAESDNVAAQAALQQSLAPDQTLTLIKQSLDALQATYQQFFSVSSIIQTLLPQ